MLNISADTWGAIGVLGGGLSAVVMGVIGKISHADKIARNAELKILKDDHAHELETIRSNIVRVHELQKTNAENLKSSWEKIDELRESVVRKAELKEYRAEVKQDMKDLGDRLERAIRDGLDSIKERRGEKE